MPWLATPEFTLNQRALLTYNFNPAVAMSNVGIELLSVPASGYRRYGYLWVRAPFTVDSRLYSTEVNAGPIWRRSYRWEIRPTSQVTAILFSPSRACPIPTQVRIVYFVP